LFLGDCIPERLGGSFGSSDVIGVNEFDGIGTESHGYQRFYAQSINKRTLAETGSFVDMKKLLKALVLLGKEP
jgi:hypothetical protein